MTRDQSFKTNFSKMTFACLSQATATSARVFHQTQNTFNRIQNTFITDEIHDQGKNYHFRSEILREYFSIFKMPDDFSVVIDSNLTSSSNLGSKYMYNVGIKASIPDLTF